MSRTIGKYLIGERFKNNKGQEYEILEYVPKDKRKIKFIETGYETETHITSIVIGTVRDRLVPTVFGIGINDVKGANKHPLYKRWLSMLSRCYNEKAKNYKWYGANGVTVCKEWQTFSNYIRDIEQKENYDKLIKNRKAWHLDKDKLVPGNKIYCNETVCIIPAIDNTRRVKIKN